MLLALVLALLVPASISGGEAGPDCFVPARRWALVVGAGRYETLGRLSYATSDARAFADALVTKLGFERANVRLLTDDAEDERLTPTAGHVIGELESLLADKRRSRSDLFVFYFCGHGVGNSQGDYLLPVDARRETVARVGLPVKEVVDRLATVGMRNVLVLVDACREGKENAFGQELWKLSEQAGLAVVLGCEPGKQSYEDPSFGNGGFTHFLVEALGDESLFDPVSGALWATRVAARTRERVSEWSRMRDPPQRPVAWANPGRDVLLRARPPSGRAGDDIAEFTRSLAALDVESRLAALREYAEALYGAGRPEDCIEVLKAVEQLGPLSVEASEVLAGALLRLGRTAEAARALREIRASAPDSIEALVATVVDRAGDVAPRDRALAAVALSEANVEVPLDLLVLMVEAALHGGESARALEIARSALGQAPASTREQAYLAAICALLEGRTSDTDAALAKAEELPGSFPPPAFVREERVRLLAQSAGATGPLALLDDCVARWPEDGRWLAYRAYYRRQALSDPAGIEDVRADARAALERPLEPESLLIATRAAGAYALELADAIATRAAEYPLSWQARVAALFARQPANMREALAEAAQLAARPASAYALMVRLTYDAQSERAAEIARQQPGDEVLAELRSQMETMTRAQLERLVPMARDLGADADAWALVGELFRAVGEHEAFARLLERTFGAEVEAGKLPEELVPVFAWACLDTGRWARFAAVQRSARAESLDADGLTWLGAAYLAAEGRDGDSRAMLGERALPRDPRLVPIARPLRALVAARAGEGDSARAELAGLEPGSTLAVSLAALALHALGDAAAADALVERLQNVTTGLFAVSALWRSQPGLDPRELALHAMLALPGNALLAAAHFAPEPGLAPFTGEHAVHEYLVESAGGPLAAEQGRLTLTVSAKGRVTGTLILADESALVVEGTLDQYGNLEAAIKRRSEGDVALLAKLAPRDVFDAYPTLAQIGQVFLVLDPDGIPYRWLARPTD